MATFAPAAASIRAVASPSPEAPPVTIAAFPEISIMFSSFFQGNIRISAFSLYRRSENVKIELLVIIKAPNHIHPMTQTPDDDLSAFDADKLESDKRLRSEEHTSELQSRENLVCRLLLEKKK